MHILPAMLETSSFAQPYTYTSCFEQEIAEIRSKKRRALKKICLVNANGMLQRFSKAHGIFKVQVKFETPLKVKNNPRLTLNNYQ